MTLLPDRELLATCIWDEARGESQEGRVAVGRTVMNRKALHYESDGTISGTVLKKDQYSGFYFAFIGGHYSRIGSTELQAEGEAQKLFGQATADPPVWAACLAAADVAMEGVYAGYPEVAKLGPLAVNYVNLAVSTPVWAKPDLYLGKIGHHTFYRAAGVHAPKETPVINDPDPQPTATPVDQAAITAAVVSALAQAQTPQPAAPPAPTPLVTPQKAAVGIGGILAGAAASLGGITLNNSGGLPAAKIDLTPILQPLEQIALLVVLAIAGWAVGKAATWLHVNTQSKARDVVLGAVDNAIQFAFNKATAAIPTSVGAPQAQAVAANYVISKIPGTLKTIGIDVATAAGRQSVADLITARLPQS